MSARNIFYIISNINKAIAFEWIVDQLPGDDIELSFILLNSGNSEFESFLKRSKTPTYHIHFEGIKHFLRASYEIFRILRKAKPTAIHCHLFYGSLIGLFAGKAAGIKKRVYTRHHSTYNHQYNWKGVWLDKIINYLATDIVAISKNVQTILKDKEQVSDRKMHLIHHGFDLAAFENVNQEKIDILKSKYNISNRPVIGVIARWIEWKGIQYIIPAFKKLLNDYPNALLILANAHGPYKPEVERLLNDLPENSYRIIPFENDLFSLYQLFDVYIHTPINSTIEAFGQTYVEALAAGIPSVFTPSGVAPEFIEHEKNALVVPFEDSEAIYKSVLILVKDKKLRDELIKNGRKDVNRFELNCMIKKLTILYKSQSTHHK